MLYNDVVDVYREVRTKNEYFESIIDYKVLYEGMEGDMQPYNSQLSLAEYGYNEECNYRLFCDVADIQNTDKVVYSGKEFIVKSVIKWDGHMEVLLYGWYKELW